MSEKMILHVLPTHWLKVKCTYNGVKKAMQKLFRISQSEKNRGNNEQETLHLWKEIIWTFSGNFQRKQPAGLEINTGISKPKSWYDMKSNSDLTEEINDIKDDMVDYYFYYERYLQWNWKEQWVGLGRGGAGAVYLADMSVIQIVTVSISQENKQW